jgi:hypothetical protein
VTAEETPQGPPICPKCNGPEFKPGRFWHDANCPERTAAPAADAQHPRLSRGVNFSPEDLVEMRKNASKWKSGDAEGLGNFIRENGFLALQVLAAVMTAPGGHRSSNQQRVASAKAFVAMSAEVVGVIEALDSRHGKSHRRPAALREQDQLSRLVSPQAVPEEKTGEPETASKSLN